MALNSYLSSTYKYKEHINWNYIHRNPDKPGAAMTDFLTAFYFTHLENIFILQCS